jgi:hypothetical protein
VFLSENIPRLELFLETTLEESDAPGGNVMKQQ